MTSAWGSSWGSSWANSWGGLSVPAVEPPFKRKQIVILLAPRQEELLHAYASAKLQDPQDTCYVTLAVSGRSRASRDAELLMLLAA